ncbi:hypothetical protein G6009_00860 [Dietzia sp. SLG510A3-30A2]|nr:hypothetical protein [Dietzia sp. SLG510A3-30A2]
MSITEADMLAALRRKYTRIRRGTNADRYVRAEHVRKVRVREYEGKQYTSTFDAERIADLIVIDTYGDTETIGIEVKVTRSDWLCELRDPTKADAWRLHCHRWYLAVPDTSIVRDDLPDGWGLIAPGKGGEMRVRKQCPRIDDPAPLDKWTAAQMARAIAKTARKEADAA